MARTTYISASILTILILVGAASAARPDSMARKPRPFGAPAPAGQYGLTLNGEYDRRWMGNDLATVQRWLATGGYTLSSEFAVWLESGVAAMDILDGDLQLEGEYGLALGAGWSLQWTGFPYWDLIPFATGRAMQTQSYLVRRQGSGATAIELHSRYQWQEAIGFIGLQWPRWGALWSGGAAMRALFQDEFRSTRTSGSATRRQFVYKSGVRPGVMWGLRLELPQRFSIAVLGEAYSHAQKITISVGQWGAL